MLLFAFINFYVLHAPQLKQLAQNCQKHKLFLSRALKLNMLDVTYLWYFNAVLENKRWSVRNFFLGLLLLLLLQLTGC